MVHVTTIIIRSHYIVSHSRLNNELGGMWKEAAGFNLRYQPLIYDFAGCIFLGVGLRPQVRWDCDFESRWGHGCLSFMSVA